MTYQGIVHISNEIRFVLDTARHVNLAAQNASLAARRAGNARGFQAVAAELKSFSQELAQAMGDMSGDILAIAQGVSLDYHQRRHCGHYATTLGRIDAGELLDGALQRAGRRRAAVLTGLGARIQHLELRVKNSLRLCSNGRALARSARIEATCGGATEGILRNVAQDIERTIGDIHERLKTIRARLHSEQEQA